MIKATVALEILLVCTWLFSPVSPLRTQQRGSGRKSYQISPKPCTVNNMEGTCMFVWECIKSEGEHLGMCVDSFMFGSCCAHNQTANNVVPVSASADSSSGPAVLYSPPDGNKSSAHYGSGHSSELLHGSSSSTRPNRPDHSTKTSPKPSQTEAGAGDSGHYTQVNTVSKTSPRPHRPSGNELHAGNSARPHGVSFVTSGISRPAVSSTTTKLKPVTTNDVPSSYSSTAQPPRGSVSLRPMPTEGLGTWATKPAYGTTVWQATTEPNFITKPRPKPVVSKPKPTKKPTIPSSTTTRMKTTTTQSPSTAVSPVYQTPTSRPHLNRPASNNRPGEFHLRPEESGVGPGFHVMTIPQPEIKKPSTPKPISPTSDAMMPTSTLSSVSASTGDRSAKCGVTPLFPRPEKRIVGGKNAPFGRWPWQVSVRRTSFFGFSSTHRCGGAVLNENWIATAGHCVDDLLTSQIRIRVGEYDFSKPLEEYPFVERMVAKKVVHPKYNFFTYEYDLALVQLDKPLEFAPHISPICLPASDDLLIGENATVTGWGRLSEGGTLPSVLQEVQVPIVSNDRCKSMFLRAGRHEYIPEIFLCAGHERGGQDSCQGDSGGPLQVKGKDGRYFLAGIISWGIGCAEANLPGVCTRISKFVPWILENVT